ncbi:cytochrome family protein [Bradyrhizobium sp. 38]|nr:cytochrome family protein [Bradyrhizobium sp. 38]MCK1778927.1 cytochrome family protein [Bradyrhizobium sp. 132]
MIAIALTAFLAIGLVSSRSIAAEPEAPSPAAIGYLPSIGDLMIETIQPRHERLWRAEQEGNWDFAAYELRALRGAFDRLGRSHPTDQQISLPQMISSVTEQPFKELNSAIQAKNGTAFAKAYADLTDACNSCHQALNHGVVEIRVPTRTSPSDLNATD